MFKSLSIDDAARQWLVARNRALACNEKDMPQAVTILGFAEANLTEAINKQGDK